MKQLFTLMALFICGFAKAQTTAKYLYGNFSKPGWEAIEFKADKNDIRFSTITFWTEEKMEKIELVKYKQWFDVYERCLKIQVKRKSTDTNLYLIKMPLSVKNTLPITVELIDGREPESSAYYKKFNLFTQK